MEKFDLENFPTSPSAVQMLGYVSQGFYYKSYAGKWLYQVMGLEYDAVLEVVESLPEQFFPEMATWGLMYHEIKWGLPVRENLSYEERRRLIYEKRDLKAPMTPYRMEQYLKTITGHEVHIADVNDPGDYGFVAAHPNMFKAYFIGNETLDSKRICEMLDRLKQSHTTYQVNHLITMVISQNKETFCGKLRHCCGINHAGRNAVSFTICSELDFSEQETVELTVETRTADHWSFDGSVLLDGSRQFNSVFREERVE